MKYLNNLKLAAGCLLNALTKIPKIHATFTILSVGNF